MTYFSLVSSSNHLSIALLNYGGKAQRLQSERLKFRFRMISHNVCSYSIKSNEFELVPWTLSIETLFATGMNVPSGQNWWVPNSDQPHQSVIVQALQILDLTTSLSAQMKVNLRSPKKILSFIATLPFPTTVQIQSLNLMLNFFLYQLLCLPDFVVHFSFPLLFSRLSCSIALVVVVSSLENPSLGEKETQEVI